MLSNFRTSISVTTLLLVSLACFWRGTDRSAGANLPIAVNVEAEPSGSRAGLSDGEGAARWLDEAARQNASLQSTMTWSFGGRLQTGWSIYIPLIASMLGADEDPASHSFARKLSRWQAGNGLQPSGILDDKTWYRMVSVFQGARLKDRTVPSLDRLVTAPITDWYDLSRAEDLRKVEHHAYETYQRLVRAAAADRSLGLATVRGGNLAPQEKYFKIISAFRLPRYQDQLRRQSPGSGSAGLAVNSTHFSGRALDLYVGGNPVSTADENRAKQVKTPAYRWLVKNAARFGFRPYFYEPWHWEYVKN